MVNKINKPPPSADLGERLANSNRNLQQMQEEHRQLLLEMEQLRQQAAELSSLNERRITESVTIRTESSNEAVVEESTLEQSTDNSSANSVNNLQESDDIPSSSSNSVQTTEESNVPLKDSDVVKVNSDSGIVEIPAKEEPNVSTENNDTDDNAEEADYIKDKLAEIASLKAQFRRVQNLIDTTDLIEQHLASKPNNDADNVRVPNVSANNVEDPIPSSVANPEPTQTENNTHDENRELLSTMLTMFNDFTSDLRGQADNLRAERERIKQLKEEILSHKQQQNK